MSPVERQVKSKRRVADCGEVFTAKREVEAMIDLVKDEVERFDSKILEPSCGDGNFLAPILERKLATVRVQFGNMPEKYGKYALVALGSLYGVELLDDNAHDCRERLFEIWEREYKDVARENYDEEDVEIARRILDENIIRGNFLTLKKVDENAKDLDEPIMVAEWLLDGDRIVCRREILQAEQTKMEKNTLFDMEQSEPEKEEREIVVETQSTDEIKEPAQEPEPVQEAEPTSTDEAPKNIETQEETPKKKTRANKEIDPNKPKRTRKSKKAVEKTPVESLESVPTEETPKEPENVPVVQTFETKVAVVSRLLEENVVVMAERFLRNAFDTINYQEDFRACQYNRSDRLFEALDEAEEALTDIENAARITDLEACRPKFERFSNACQRCCNIVNSFSSLSEEKRDELMNEAKAIIKAISPYL